MTHARRPAERTLKEMLREAAGYAYNHGGPGWDIPFAVVRRAAEVVRTFHPGMFQPSEVRNAMDVYAAIADAILADAGLDEEKRDE